MEAPEGTEKALEPPAEPEDAAQRSLARAINASFGMLRLIMVVVGLLMLSECMQYLEEGSVGVKRRFGRYLRDGNGALVVYKPEDRFVFVLPYPIEELQRVPLDTQTVALSSEFWPKVDITEAALANKTLPEQKSFVPGRDGYAVTGELDLVHGRWEIEYRVVDPARYLLGIAGDSNDPEAHKEAVDDLIRRVAAGTITRVLAGRSSREVLGEGVRGVILEALRQDLTALAGGQGIGIEVTALTGSGAWAPGMAQKAFEDYAKAVDKGEAMLKDARAMALNLQAQSETEARRFKQRAEVVRRRIREKARADAAALEELLEKFQGDPAGLRLYLTQRRQDWFKDILTDASVTLTPVEGRQRLKLAPAPREARSQEGR